MSSKEAGASTGGPDRYDEHDGRAAATQTGGEKATADGNDHGYAVLLLLMLGCPAGLWIPTVLPEAVEESPTA